jgi:uncharacterized protein (TIGR00730 family)
LYNPAVPQEIRSVTVYCSSSSDIPRHYLDAGRDLGASIARAGWTLVYGGNRIGMMAAVADAAREAGGKVVGITPQRLVDEGIADVHCDELVVTAGMRERKALLEQRADAFVALPGGLGTFEELFEILVGRLLGYHDKPIVLLNIAGYYDALLAAIEHGIAEGFIKARSRSAFHVAADVRGAMDYLHSAPPARPSPLATPGAREPSVLE